VSRGMAGESVVVLLGAAAVGAAVAGIATVRGLRSRRGEGVPAEQEPLPETSETADRPRAPEPAASADEPLIPALTVVEASVDVGRPSPANLAEAPPVEPLSDAGPGSNRHYDEPACRALAAGLTDDQLVRAQALFEALARDGAVTAKDLAAELDVAPGQLPGLLITPLRKCADGLDLPLPFTVSHAKGSKLRQWEDADGVALRMSRAIEQRAPRSERQKAV